MSGCIKSCRVEASRGGEEAEAERVEGRRKGIGLQIDIRRLFSPQIEFMEWTADRHWTIQPSSIYTYSSWLF